jgi:hypothetical protein
MAPIAVQQAGAPAPASADEHVFLIGRPPLSEYLGYIETQTLEGQTAARAAWADRWRAANDHIHQLEQDEAGWADKPPITPLEDDLIPLRNEVSRERRRKVYFSRRLSARLRPGAGPRRSGGRMSGYVPDSLAPFSLPASRAGRNASRLGPALSSSWPTRMPTAAPSGVPRFI